MKVALCFQRAKQEFLPTLETANAAEKYRLSKPPMRREGIPAYTGKIAFLHRYRSEKAGNF